MIRFRAFLTSSHSKALASSLVSFLVAVVSADGAAGVIFGSEAAVSGSGTCCDSVINIFVASVGTNELLKICVTKSEYLEFAWVSSLVDRTSVN